jgi:hypothetical protein
MLICIYDVNKDVYPLCSVILIFVCYILPYFNHESMCYDRFLKDFRRERALPRSYVKAILMKPCLKSPISIGSSFYAMSNGGTNAGSHIDLSSGTGCC